MAVSTGPKIPIMVGAEAGDAYLSQGNAFLRAMQVFFVCNVISMSESAPPGTPNNGDTYVVAAGGSGDWNGQDNNIAYWTTDNENFPGGTWEFWVPSTGWIVGNQLDNTAYLFVQTAWQKLLRLGGTHGEYWQAGVASEEITLNTGGTTTDSAANLLPANSIIDAVVTRVTTTITTATEFEVGDAGTSDRFVPTTTDITAGDTEVGLAAMAGGVASDAAGPTQTAAAKVRITTDVNPGAGKVRVSVFYRTFVAPTS